MSNIATSAVCHSEWATFQPIRSTRVESVRVSVVTCGRPEPRDVFGQAAQFAADDERGPDAGRRQFLVSLIELLAVVVTVYASNDQPVR